MIEIYAQVTVVEEEVLIIAVKKELRPTLITISNDICEQVFVRLTLASGLSVFLAGVYLPPGTNLSVYESHVEALDQVWRSYNFDLGLVCGYFNTYAQC